MEPWISSPADKNPPSFSVRNHIDPVRTLPPCFYKIRFSIRPLTLRFPGGSSYQSFVRISVTFYFYHMTRLSHPPWSSHPGSIWPWVKIMKLLIMQFSPAFSYYIPFLRFQIAAEYKKWKSVQTCCMLQVVCYTCIPETPWTFLRLCN